MNRFIKDNLMLLILGSVAVIIALVLLVLVIIEHTNMFRNHAQVETLISQVEELIRQKPAPVKGNIEPIQQGIDIYKGNVERLQRNFSGLKAPAIEAFTKELGVPLDDFKKKFIESWESDSGRDSPGGRGRFYQRFKRDYPKWDSAIDAFWAIWQHETIEKMGASNQSDIFMSAFNIPRTMENRPDLAKSYNWVMQGAMRDIFLENKVNVFQKASNFSFDEKVLLPASQIAQVPKNWEAIGDIGKRIATSGVRSLNSFEKRSLAGEMDGEFLIRHYTFSITGEIDKIRALVENFHGATKDRRFYIVRSVNLYATHDSAISIFEEREREIERMRLEAEEGKLIGEGEGPAQTSRPRTRPTRPEYPQQRPGYRQQRPGYGAPEGEKVMTDEEIKAAIMKLPYNKRPGYGALLFGGTKQCDAVIDIEYITLAEPELN